MRLAQQTLPPPALLANPSTHLAGRKLLIARGIWAALFSLFVGLFLLGAPISFQHALVLSDATRQELIARH